MSIGAIANIVSTTSTVTAASRSEPAAERTGPGDGPPRGGGQQDVAAPQDATVTTLSDEARAQQAADEQAARDAEQAALAAAGASTSAVTSLVYRDWAAGAPAVDDGAVQEALNALDEASRENLQAATAQALSAREDQAAQQQEAIDDAAALTDQQRELALLHAVNAEIRLAYGALPSPHTGDPVLREPGQVDVIA